MKFFLNKDKLTIENEECLNSGAIQYYNAEVEKDDSWDNLTIEARIVKKEDGRIEDVGNAIAVIGNSIYIDREINGTYAIGFIGYRIENEVKTYQISSNLVSVFFNQGAGELEVDNSQDVPTPSEWEIYIAQIEDLVNDLEGRIPTKYSDLINDNNTVQDANYVHTDNNYTTAEKTKLAGLENYDDTQVKQDIASLQTNKADKSEIPDVSEFITKSVNDLVNYYKKTETYTQAEVNSLIGAVSSLKIEIVQTLPTEDISTSTIYLVPKTASTNDNYDEYIYVSNNWEHIGSTEVDLTGYATEAWVNIQIADFLTETQIETLLLGKVDKEAGKGLSTNDYTNIDKSKVDKISNMMTDLTATGTSISTTKSADWYGDLNVEGFSRQNTRSGKNLLNVPSTFSVTGSIKKDLVLSANTQYKISFASLDIGTATGSLWSFIGEDNDEDNPVATKVVNPNTLSYTITPTANVAKVRIYSRTSYSGSLDKTAIYTNAMVRLGSITDDTYEEYGVSPSPDYPSSIRNLENSSTYNAIRFIDTNSDNTQEYIVDFPLQEGQKLYEDSILTDEGILNYRKQIVFDGSEDENWKINANQTGANTSYFYIRQADMKEGTSLICDRFTEGSTWGTDIEAIQSLNSTDIRVRINTSRASTVAGLKSWLSTHNLVVEYELAESEIVAYTEAQQIAYNKLKEFPTYQGVNNISLVANEEATMTLHYKEDLSEAISGKEDKTNKVTTISASSTDTQYPSAKCVYDIVGNIETQLGGI